MASKAASTSGKPLPNTRKFMRRPNMVEGITDGLGQQIGPLLPHQPANKPDEGAYQSRGENWSQSCILFLALPASMVVQAIPVHEVIIGFRVPYFYVDTIQYPVTLSFFVFKEGFEPITHILGVPPGR